MQAGYVLDMQLRRLVGLEVEKLEAELRDLVERAQQRGVVEQSERDMIESVFELGETIVREVMVPRTDIVVIERGKTVRQALNLSNTRDHDARKDEIHRKDVVAPGTGPADQPVRNDKGRVEAVTLPLSVQAIVWLERKLDERFGAS